MAIGSKSLPVYVDSNGNVQPISLDKNIPFLGTDSSGNLVRGTAGDIIDVSGNTIKVKNNIPSGYTGIIGIDANRRLVPQSVDIPESGIPTSGAEFYSAGLMRQTRTFSGSQIRSDNVTFTVIDNGVVDNGNGSTTTLNSPVIINGWITINDLPPTFLLQMKSPTSSSWYSVFRMMDTGRVEGQTGYFTIFFPKGYSLRLYFHKYEQAPYNYTATYEMIAHRLLLT